ncbi:AAEL003556-PA, partial [Aedes aegypti]
CCFCRSPATTIVSFYQRVYCISSSCLKELYWKNFNPREAEITKYEIIGEKWMR